MPTKGSVSFQMGGHEGGRQDFPWLQNSILNVLKVKGGALTPNPAIFLPETCLSSILGAWKVYKWRHFPIKQDVIWVLGKYWMFPLVSAEKAYSSSIRIHLPWFFTLFRKQSHSTKPDLNIDFLALTLDFHVVQQWRVDVHRCASHWESLGFLWQTWSKDHLPLHSSEGEPVLLGLGWWRRACCRDWKWNWCWCWCTGV